MFKGSIVAIVTPFNNGAVDEQKLRELVDFQIDNGTDGIVACGTTGEASTLDYEEHMDVVRIVFEQSKGRVPVIAGTGSNSTAEAIELTQKAKDLGCDGVLLVTPYYNKPTQEGLVRHYTAVADAVDIPQILYNVLGTTPATTSQTGSYAVRIEADGSWSAIDTPRSRLTVQNWRARR